MLPVRGLKLAAPVSVHWDAHQIPFIEAESDADLAMVLGAVHVHLRWTQMELMRRLSQGRVAEMIGPLGIEIDHALRLVDFGRAVPRMVEALPAETRAWLEAFVAGVNQGIELASALPPEFGLLGLRREVWTIADVLTLGRLVSLDVTWFTWMGLLRQNQAVADAIWRRVTAVAESIGRSGSNSVVVAGSRSETGAAWLASDPHLGASLPGPWLLAGYWSPGFKAVGLMIPGVPMFALGRNPHVAWGGTNLHAASSDLVDVSAIPAGEITVRHETVRVRWGRPRSVALRETRFGPIVSDASFLRLKRAVALRWMGHQPSDELTAMLRISRARSWQEFREAAELFGVPGQNLVYADADGHVGKLMAVRLPERAAVPAPPILPPEEAGWERVMGSAALPATFNPADGVVASANERPEQAPVPVGYVFSPRTRFERLRELALQGCADFELLRAIQLDTMVRPALGFRDVLLGLLQRHASGAARLAACLSGWDGRYEAESDGALGFELLVHHLLVALRGRKTARIYSHTWRSRALARAEIEAADTDALARAAPRAARAADRDLRRFACWGGLHRLALPHPFAAIPLLGRPYRFGGWPVAGSNEALMKTSHPVTNRRHAAGLVVTARHISDLSNPDRNWFVLLGGQDGWLGSTTLMDQVPLWRGGEYVHLPLRPETVRRLFPHRTEFRA